MNELLIYIFALLGLIGTGLWGGGILVTNNFKDVPEGLHIAGAVGVASWIAAIICAIYF